MVEVEPLFPGVIRSGTVDNPDRTRVTLADVEALRPRNLDLVEKILEFARVEASLPDAIWDRAIILEDIIVQTLKNPSRSLDDQYRYLRRYFMEDTGTHDLVPDFVEANEELHAVWRYLDRMDVSLEEQIEHVGAAFQTLAEYMELVFRPRSIGYEREPWPGKPPATPISQRIPDPNPSPIDSAKWTGMVDPAAHARRVLALAPLALTSLEKLIETAEKARADNAPPDQLGDAELGQLRELHQAIGDLIATARRGGDIAEKLGTVRSIFRSAFRLLRHTGELVVADVPPIAAAMMPSWATYGVCSAFLGLSEGSSAAFAVGTMAVSGGMQATRQKTTPTTSIDN